MAIPGYWSLPIPAQVGVISVQGNTSERFLVWKIRDENLDTREFLFGSEEDSYVSGGDYNGNGYYA